MTQGLRRRPASVCRFAIGLLVVGSTIGCTSTGKRTSEPLPPLPTPRVAAGPTAQPKTLALPSPPGGPSTRTSPTTPTNFSGAGANLDTPRGQPVGRSFNSPSTPIAAPVNHQNPAVMQPIAAPTPPPPTPLPSPLPAPEIKPPTFEPTSPTLPRTTRVVSPIPPEPNAQPIPTTPTLPTERIIVPTVVPPGAR